MTHPRQEAEARERGSLDLRAAWIDEIERVAACRRWGKALVVLGWIHLLYFLGLQALLWRTGGDPHWPYPIAWVAELATALFTMRAICGPGWARDPAMAGVLVRVWATFFILSFNLASSNQLTGWQVIWFKSAWCTLATFGFATMAWVLSLWFLVPAVGFYFLGLLSVRFPDLFYLMHGLAWCLTLNVIGAWLERRRRDRVLPATAEPRFRHEHAPATANPAVEVARS